MKKQILIQQIKNSNKTDINSIIKIIEDYDNELILKDNVDKLFTAYNIKGIILDYNLTNSYTFESGSNESHMEYYVALIYKERQLTIYDDFTIVDIDDNILEKDVCNLDDTFLSAIESILTIYKDLVYEDGDIGLLEYGDTFDLV